MKSEKRNRKPWDARRGNLNRRLILAGQRGLEFHTHVPESEAGVERSSPGPVLDTVPRVSTPGVEVRSVILERSLWEWERHIPTRGVGGGQVHWPGHLSQVLPMSSCRPLLPKVGTTEGRATTGSCRNDWGRAILGWAILGLISPMLRGPAQ